MEGTTTIYSPHVLILEGIFALYDQRVLELLDLKLFAEADLDVCLARRSMCFLSALNKSLRNPKLSIQ